MRGFTIDLITPTVLICSPHNTQRVIPSSLNQYRTSFIMSGLFGLPKRSGKLKTLNKFDATFFGVHPKQANNMDPQLRMLLEVTYEAIVDSGKCTH